MISNIKRKMRKDNEEGFTLIELLVVVLILGILMAIAIPTFLSLTSGAKTSAAESDLTTASQDAATQYTQNGTYGASGTAAVAALALIDTGLNYASATMGAAGGKNVDIIWTSANLIQMGTAGQNSTWYWVNDAAGTLTYAFTSAALATTGAASADFTGHTSWSTLTGTPPAT